MTVYEYLLNLVTVELKNAQFSKDIAEYDKNQAIESHKFASLLYLLKAGMMELSTRFNLSEQNSGTIRLPKGTHTINLTEFNDDHQLYWGMAFLQLQEVYLMDTPNTTMYPQDFKQPKLVLPDSRLQTLRYMDDNSVVCDEPCYFMPNLHTLCIYSPYDYATYQLIAKVVYGMGNDIGIEDSFDFPMAYRNALGLYIASRYFRRLDNQLDGDLNESTRYYQAYLQEIQMLENKGIALDRQPQQHSFHQKGFV